MEAGVRNMEKIMGTKFGATSGMPLLVAVRSGARDSMPGMMDTILNLGLNDQTVLALEAATGNPRFAYDCYRRFIQMFSTTAMGLSKEPMEQMLHKMKHDLGVKTDPEIPADKLKELCEQFKAFYKEKKGEQCKEIVCNVLKIKACNAVLPHTHRVD
jgi:pyruvate,orthophosphate dikinase